MLVVAATTKHMPRGGEVSYHVTREFDCQMKVDFNGRPARPVVVYVVIDDERPR